MTGEDLRSGQLRELLTAQEEKLTPDTLERVIRYYELLLEESSRQNLTRLLDPPDFFKGHWLDTAELLRSGLVDYPAMDLGSGPGVPGLLAALVRGGPWVLSESEGRKAEFLRSTCSSLGLANVEVAGQRAETYLSTHEVASVVVRAVGPVERIHGWLRKCSTWNNLVLLKGPRWTEEWTDFTRGRWKTELKVDRVHSYSIDEATGTRQIVKLRRS